MNKKILYGLILLLTLSFTLGVVSASENITESALLGVEDNYIAEDEALSLSIENDDQTLGLLNEDSIEDDNETLSLTKEESNGDEILEFGEPVQTMEKGADYVPMSNGYTAFCADRVGTFPTKGTQYATEQQYILTHDKRVGERVDNKLRLVMVHYVDRPEFKEKIRNPYAAGAFSRTQQLVWYLTNYDELKPYSFEYLERDPILRDAYYDIINRHNNGEWINEDSMTYTYDGYQKIYEFLAFKSSSTYQKLVGYKVTIKEIPTPKNPGMEVDKKSLTPNVNVGEQTLFLITVRNTGDVALNNVFVEEQIPDGLTYADYSDKSLWRKDGNVFYYNNVLAVGQSASFTIAFDTHINGTFVNCVVADSDETDNKKSNNTTTVKKPGMEVDKKSLTPNVNVGEQTLFLITVRNTGELDLANVFVEEDMPEGLTYDSFSGDKWTKNGNKFTYNDILTVGQSASFTIAFNTSKEGKFINCVVAGSDKTENKTSNNTTTVSKEGLDVQKITITPQVMVGNQAKFEIVVKNTGNLVLNNVFIEESYYDGLIFDHAEYQSHWVHSIVNGKNRWTLNTPLVIDEVAGLIVVFNTTKAGTFTNVVVAGSDETENKTTENKTKVVEPKFDVQKITIAPTVLVGQQVTFEIVVRNTGEVDLTNVFIDEHFPDGLIYDSYLSGEKWKQSVVNGIYRWTLIGTLTPNEVIELLVTFNTTKTGKFTNVVVVGSDETKNKTTENNTNVVEGKIDVQKITIDPIVLVGDKVQFEIIVKNNGKIPLHNVVLEETSYNGLIFDSFVDNKLWTHSVANGKNIWSLNKVLNVNEIVPLLVNFNTVTVGNFTNVVTVNSDETGKKVANNTTIVYNKTKPTPEENSSTNPQINIEKIALQNIVILGNQAVFEIIVSNTGNVALHDVTVNEDSFDGLLYDSWYDNTGLWTKNSDLTWTMNSPLYLGEIATFYIVFNTQSTGEFTNIVSVDSKETDKKSANDTVEVIKPDFAVEKIAINRSVLVGEQVMFEIVVHNLGQVDLTNVVVREDSFDGLVYDSFIDYTGLWTKNSDLSWTLNTPLSIGEYSGFFIIFNTTTTGKFVNVVVADSNEIPNKTANDTVEVLKLELEVQKITINRTVYFGEKVMFEIVVHHVGKVVLNDVIIRENSFDGLVYDSFIDYYNVWTKNSDLSWTLNAPLYAGEYLSLFVVFNTNKAGTFTNIVSASSDKTPDKYANNITTVIDKPVEEENKTKINNDTKNVTDVPETPKQPNFDQVDVGTTATGNPLIMVLLALLILLSTGFRRKD